MRWLWDREPALIVGVIEALILVGVAFGLPITTDQLAQIMAFVIALGALITRRSVYAPATIQDEIVFEADDEFLD